MRKGRVDLYTVNIYSSVFLFCSLLCVRIQSVQPATTRSRIQWTDRCVVRKKMGAAWKTYNSIREGVFFVRVCVRQQVWRISRARAGKGGKNSCVGTFWHSVSIKINMSDKKTRFFSSFILLFYRKTSKFLIFTFVVVFFPIACRCPVVKFLMLFRCSVAAFFPNKSFLYLFGVSLYWP